MKILITSGGTEEPIDGVRSITNFSTGKTGAVLADRLTELGAEVTLLHGKRAVLPRKEMEMHSFTSFADLDGQLQNLLRGVEFNAVIHLAAVSDFSVDYIETEQGEILEPDDHGKISSDVDLVLHLKRNFKILDRLRSYCPSEKKPLVTGFKLTDTDSTGEREEAVKKILHSGSIDYLVHNNLHDITETEHRAGIYDSRGEKLFSTKTKEELADRLFILLTGERN